MKPRRPTTSQRGYGTSHQKIRKKWARIVARGDALCTRCGVVILPTDEWHLDHTDDRSGYLGAACAFCNRSAGGKKAAANRSAPVKRWTW
jgi:hypothetical protein